MISFEVAFVTKTLFLLALWLISLGRRRPGRYHLNRLACAALKKAAPDW